MKKTITLLLLFAVIGLKAQFSIYYISSPLLCPGDTISILFMWKNAPAQCQFNIAQGVNNQIHSVNGFTFHTLPKSLIESDTIYMIKFKTSNSFQLGIANVSTNWVNTTPIYFICDIVGLNEINKTSNETKIYFDILGLPTDLTPNKLITEIIITPNGISRRKIIISD
jgi:hypothetical protein